MLRFSSNRERTPWVTWVALGAGLMYLLDSASGHRRRALVRDKLIHLARVGTTGACRAKRDLTHRVRGLGLRVRAKTRPEEQVSDEVLCERVRSKMGVFVSHPHAVEVRVHNGAVMLRGPILGREATAFVRRVKRMAGVRQLEDRLERHRSPGRVPALQGGVERRRRAEILQRHWTPGVRFLAGAAGIALVAAGVSKRHRPVLNLGAAVLLRAWLNVPFRQMLASTQRQPFVQRRALENRGTNGRLATAEVVVAAPSAPDPTPSEQAQQVARSIRE